ncbi:unnamed protein product [Spirodela intermedia]|uniref:Hydrophobic seed protein domain-containing protein n=1 Tax=Spirodela intermedia TaxID=51605 RepID=A0A7I8JY56_SPIIN|nr:unnamed protein product [Spirodela intermedia]
MATKTQATAVFLLLNLMFCTFASGQLIPVLPSIPVVGCVVQLAQAVACGLLLNLLKIGSFSAVLNATCCALFASLTSGQTAQCLCIGIRLRLLGLNVSIPGDINLILQSCGKNITIGGCP